MLPQKVPLFAGKQTKVLFVQDNSQKLRDRSKEAIAKEMRRDFVFKKVTDILLTEYPEAEWLVDRLIPSGELTFVTGRSATFKSYLMFALALSVAKGVPFLNEFPTTETGVLLIHEENDEPLLKQRFRQIGTSLTSNIYIISRLGFKLDFNSVDVILDQCKTLEIKLIIIDSYIRVSGVRDENSAAENSTALAHLNPLLNAGIAIILIHHHGKKSSKDGSRESQQDAMRGSSDQLASASSHITVQRSENTITLTQTKSRHTEEMSPFQVDINSDDDHVEFKYCGSESTPMGASNKALLAILEVLEMNKDGPSQKELFELAIISDSTLKPRTMRDVLKREVALKTIIEETGNKNAKRYYLQG